MNCECGNLMVHKSGVNTEGKSWGGFFCATRTCQSVVWDSRKKPKTNIYAPQQVKPEVSKKEVPTEVWIEKDRRMVRMNALSHATEAIKIIYPNIHSAEKVIYEDTFAELVKKVAETYEAWVYRPIEPKAEEVGF